MSVIYDFYEKGILLPQKSGNGVDNYSMFVYRAKREESRRMETI
jgi:hypothetical protein